MSSRPVRPRRIGGPAWRRGLLAWLILVVGLAPPPGLFAPTADSTSPAVPAGREASSEEDDAEGAAIAAPSGLIPERARSPRGPGLGRAPHRPAAGPAQARLARLRRGGGHFLGEARLLRCWIQSLLF
jgi:hypothetical protein